MRKVYRLETREEDVSERQGIYSAYLSVDDFYGAECGGNYEQHPCPNTDEGIARVWQAQTCEEYYFGFESRAQLLRWFPAAWQCGDEHGENIVMAVYNLPEDHCVIGSKQVMFVKSKAIHVGDIELAHI